MRQVPRHDIENATGGFAGSLERDAFEPLFLQLRHRMVAVARRITRDPEAAADVVQLAFERAYRRRHQFRGEARVSTWLHRIVVNEALMWLRSEGRRPQGEPLDSLPGHEFTERGAAPDEECADRERKACLERALGKLSILDRKILERCALEGWSHEEAGREFELHPGAVKSRAFRARRRLRSELADWNPRTRDGSDALPSERAKQA